MTAPEPAWAPQLRKLWATGIAPDQIAARVGVATTTVFNRVHVLGLPSRQGWGDGNWTPERVKLITKLYVDGLSASQIAKRLGGVTRNAVIGKIHRLGLSGRAEPSKPRAIKAPAVKAARIADTNKITGFAKRLNAPPRPIAGPPRAPIEVAPERVEAPGSCTILTVGAHMCRWPIGDPALESFTLCGRRHDADGPYCREHARIAYQPPENKKAASANELMRSLRRYVAA